MRRVVIALGGNALLRRGEPADADTQRRNVVTAVAAIADLAAEHEVIVTHGNGSRRGHPRPRGHRRARACASAILEGRRGTRVNAAERFTLRELDAMWET